MTIVTVQNVGQSVGIEFTPELLKRLNVSHGDHVQIVETSRGIEVIPLSEEVAAQLEVGLKVMDDSADALRELAK